MFVDIAPEEVIADQAVINVEVLEGTNIMNTPVSKSNVSLLRINCIATCICILWLCVFIEGFQSAICQGKWPKHSAVYLGLLWRAKFVEISVSKSM